jgi:hypothetical protein
MDFVMLYRLVQCLREGLVPDMNVYDAAAWSVPGPLADASVAQGGAPVTFPDFTRGRSRRSARSRARAQRRNPAITIIDPQPGPSAARERAFNRMPVRAFGHINAQGGKALARAAAVGGRCRRAGQQTLPWSTMI